MEFNSGFKGLSIKRTTCKGHVKTYSCNQQRSYCKLKNLVNNSLSLEIVFLKLALFYLTMVHLYRNM